MEKEMKCKIDWKTIDNILHFDATYDEKADILLILSPQKEPAVSIDCDGEFWMRVDPKTGEILGVEIEAYKKVFLKKHPELARVETACVRPIADFISMEKCPV